MKKIASLLVAACIGGTSALSAQSMMDAYKLSQTDNNGTARYLSMGGAFGALGGDVSSMHTNPAGLGIYRSSEIVGTVSLNMFNTNSEWTGTSTTMNKTTFNMDNFAYVGYFPTGNDEGLVSWNVGFSFNKLKNFNRRYKLRGRPGYSISDYISEFSNQDSNPITGSDIDRAGNRRWNSNYDWMTVLGYTAGFIDDYGDGVWLSDMGWVDNSGNWNNYAIEEATLEMHEKGGIDQYNFSFATNISNVVFIGTTIGVTDINYRLSSFYGEDFGQGNYLGWGNYLATDGSGVDVKLGVIVRPADFLRLGVAYNSPTWYNMTNDSDAAAESRNNYYTNDAFRSDETPRDIYDFKFRSPDKWIFSAAAILGTNALISVDYEFSNAKRAKFSYEDGGEYYGVNQDIRNLYQNTNTLKVGAEYKITPQLAIRAGGAWLSSAATKDLQENEYQMIPDGTMPHYTVDRETYSFSLGLGYRFTPRFYMDLAYVNRVHKENAYAFSGIYYGGEDAEYSVYSEPATLKTNTNRVALTLGYKF